MKNLLSQINDIVEKCKISGKRAILAIDGMSASGKTTLAEELQRLSYPHGRFSSAI